MKTIITFIIVFGILVLVHEFGHFYFAKRAGILVREFAIGMGPKILRIVEKMAPLYDSLIANWWLCANGWDGRRHDRNHTRYASIC